MRLRKYSMMMTCNLACYRFSRCNVTHVLLRIGITYYVADMAEDH